MYEKPSKNHSKFQFACSNRKYQIDFKNNHWKLIVTAVVDFIAVWCHDYLSNAGAKKF